MAVISQQMTQRLHLAEYELWFDRVEGGGGIERGEITGKL